MNLMEGKKGIIFGVSNKRGIAYAIANEIHRHGGEIAFTYANDAMKDRVTPLAEEMGSKCIVPCDVTNEEQIKQCFETYAETYGKVDFIIHAVAFANREDLSGNFSDTSREGWNLALGVSAYSLLPIVRYAKPLFNEGATVTALTYLASVRALPNYNVMGVAKAALESSMRFLALELGEQNVRANALSSGPIKTLAARGIAGFDYMLKFSQSLAPLKRNVTLDEVGKAGLYLASPLSAGVTGQVHYVDCGFSSMVMGRESLNVAY